MGDERERDFMPGHTGTPFLIWIFASGLGEKAAPDLPESAAAVKAL